MEASATLDESRRRRLRWRARRGLLENDLLLTRFLDQHQASLSEDDILGLDQLLELSDNELLDLFLQRSELQGQENTPQANAVLQRLRAA